MNDAKRPDGPLRVLVAPHNFEIGGSQINALELAEEIARRPDYEVVLYAPDGELAERARAMGVETHFSVLKERAPSLRRIRELRRLAKAVGADLVHAYEWAPTVDAAYGVAWGLGMPVLSTILSMDYPYFVPETVPVVLGTEELYGRAQREGRTAYLIEPPVDTRAFRPGAVDDAALAVIRAECGAGPEDLLVVVVGRLSSDASPSKLDGLLALIPAVGRLAGELPVHLAVVGDGPAREAVEAAAAEANAAAGREAVHVLGQRADPLPYYAAADVAVGMGSSGLRAMALGKPLLVQGEQGFWRIADEENLPVFLDQGWYGVGDGVDSAGVCAELLGRLLRADSADRDRLGVFGRELVVERYSLEAAATHLDAIYRETLARPRPTRRERLRRPLALTLEIVKYHVSIRFPGLRRAARRASGRGVPE